MNEQAEKVIHLYISTACHHARHDACRKTCKFCPSNCLCQCHGLPPALDELMRERDEARAEVAQLRDAISHPYGR